MPNPVLSGPWPGVAELVALVGFRPAELACVLARSCDGSGRVEDDALVVAENLDPQALRALCRRGVLWLDSRDEPRPSWRLAWPAAPSLASLPFLPRKGVARA